MVTSAGAGERRTLRRLDPQHPDEPRLVLRRAPPVEWRRSLRAAGLGVVGTEPAALPKMPPRTCPPYYPTALIVRWERRPERLRRLDLQHPDERRLVLVCGRARCTKHRAERY